MLQTCLRFEFQQKWLGGCNPRPMLFLVPHVTVSGNKKRMQSEANTFLQSASLKMFHSQETRLTFQMREA